MNPMQKLMASKCSQEEFSKKILEAMKKDKKDGRFILLKGIGQPVITTVKEDDLRKYTE